MRRARLAAAFAAFALFIAGRAEAFCRTTTVGVPPDYQPGDQGCWTSGLPLFWRNACVGYSIQRDASKSVSYDDASQAIAKAFTKWTGTACPTDGTGPSRASIDVRDLGPVNCSLVQYNQDQPNQHVIVFRDDAWGRNDSSNTLALTTVTFNPDTGEIYDADMEVNTHDQKVSVADQVAPDGFDFLSIVTHETGHFLGMAHSGDAHATMFAHYQPGAMAMRLLTGDDISGICTIYPPDGTRSVATNVTPDGKLFEESCDPTPRHGFGTECAAPPKKSGCSLSPVGPLPSSEARIGLVIFAACAIFLSRRHVSHSRRSAGPPGA